MRMKKGVQMCSLNAVVDNFDGEDETKEEDAGGSRRQVRC